MTFLLSLFGWLRASRLGQAVAAVLALLAAAALIRRSGAKAERRKQELRNHENYLDTRRRADSAADHARTVGGTLSDDELNGRLRKHPGAIRE